MNLEFSGQICQIWDKHGAKEVQSGKLALIEYLARQFRQETRWTLPRILTGHKVAHEEPEISKVRNFSTVTRIIVLPNNMRFFLVYRYPLSFIHSLTDNIQRLMTGKRSFKPFTKSAWENIFSRKSQIDMCLIKGTGVVFMPYIPNWNLWDILRHQVIELGHDEIYEILASAAEKIKELHAKNQVWGEPIVHNIIVEKDSHGVILCDTEVTYYPWVSLDRQKASDWMDFIFSACGSITSPVDVSQMAKYLFGLIEDQNVRTEIIRQCQKSRSIGQIFFWPAISGRLSCSLSRYHQIKRAITS